MDLNVLDVYIRKNKNKSDKKFLIQNLVLAVFKSLVYKSRLKSRLSLNEFLHQVVKERDTEKGASFNKKEKFSKRNGH